MNTEEFDRWCRQLQLPAKTRKREIEPEITDTATSDGVAPITVEELIFVDEAKQEVLEESINKRFEIDHIVAQVATFPFYLATITNNEGLIVSFSLQRLDEKDNKKPII